MDQYKALLNGSIQKSLIKMTNSISLGFISLFTFNLIDTFFIAQLGSKQLAAISFTFPIVFLWMNVFFGLNTGITAQIAKSLGSKQQDNSKYITLNGFILVIISSIIISISGYFTIDFIFAFLGASNHTLIYIKQYLPYWYSGFIFLAMTMACGAAIRGQGDAKTPSRILILSGIINGILDPILIFGLGPFPRLEVTGAVLATVISWVVSFTISFRHILTRTKLLDFNFNLTNKYKINKIHINIFISNIKSVLSIGLPSMLTNIINPIASAIIIKIVALEGFASVAGFGVGLKLEAIATIFSISLSIAMVPFVSINHGAKNYARINHGLNYAIKITMAIQLFIYVILFSLANFIAHWFSTEQNIVDIIVLYLRIIPGVYCFIGIIMIILSALNAIERAKYSILISIIRFFVLTIPLAYLGHYLYGLTGILIGIVTAKILAFIIAILIYNKVSIQSNI